MSLQRLYEVLSERYGSFAVWSVYASDFDGDYSGECWLSFDGKPVVVGEEHREGWRL